MKARSVNIDGFLLNENLQTMVYAKPYMGDMELSRIDFGAFNVYSEALIEKLLTCLEHAFANSDGVILNQQVPVSISSPPVVRRINEIIAAHPEKLCLVDARHYADHYAGATMKLNMHEAARVLNEPQQPAHTSSQATDFAARIHTRSGKPVFLTRSEHGLVATDAHGSLIQVPGLEVRAPIDTVGAGDSIVAGLSAALAVGETVEHAAEFANIASITIQQLQCTGTASAQQILSAISGLKYASSSRESEDVTERSASLAG
jgi:bifunctional ADP-heptose synthase (sugar kinase/adenylyltransferase)